MSIKPKSLFYVATSGVPTQHIVKALVSELSQSCESSHQVPGGPKLKTLCGVKIEVNGYAMLGPGITVSPICVNCEHYRSLLPSTKLFHGEDEVILRSGTEMILLAALKSILIHHGNDPSINYAAKEFRMHRFAMTDALDHQSGHIQIATDGNNGQDLVRLVK